MRNRAKCKKCQQIIESVDKYIVCSCREIGIGPHLYAAARDWDNFVRIDDDGNEISVRYEDKGNDQDQEINKQEEAHKPTKDDMIRMLDEMVKSYENLPQPALLSPVSHSDFLSLLMLVSSLFKSI